MTIPTTPIPTVELIGGTHMPMIGLGTWPLAGDECVRAVGTALRAGYRLIDTAEGYRNEAEVGHAIRTSAVPRSDIFLTTKFSKQWHSFDGVYRAAENSLKRLGLDYIDLFLMHWPMPHEGDFVAAFEGMVALRESGLVKAIGVSNFKVHHLEKLIAKGLVPEVNQIQLDPTRPRKEVRPYLDDHDIVTEAWSPLGRGDDGLMRAPEVLQAAATHGVTPAAVVLAWQINQSIVVVATSAHPDHQRINLEAAGVELSAAEMDATSALENPDADLEDSDTGGN